MIVKKSSRRDASMQREVVNVTSAKPSSQSLLFVFYLPPFSTYISRLIDRNFGIIYFQSKINMLCQKINGFRPLSKKKSMSYSL